MDSSDGQSALVAEPPSTENKTKLFRERYFPHIADRYWNNWQWQLNTRFTAMTSISAILELSDDEADAMEALGASGRIPVNITPYYLSLISRDDINQPLRRTVIPTMAELNTSCGEAEDPLCEDDDSPVPGIVHRYDDRALLLVSNRCSSYCRYCTRSRLVGGRKAGYTVTLSQLNHGGYIDDAIDYIRNNTAIRDVILSGGDPLLLEDTVLDRLLYRLRGIKHVEIVRIGTKVPAVLPQRITSDLCDILKQYHPLFASLHFVHPDEATRECTEACAKLADAGIPLGSQTVLLAGINDNIETMTSLMHKLLMMRVRPYYLYQCDPVVGTAHFRTPAEKGVEIIAGMRGFTSGYAIPTFVIDAPGGGGKVPLQQNYIMAADECGLTLKNFRGEVYHYP